MGRVPVHGKHVMRGGERKQVTADAGAQVREPSEALEAGCAVAGRSLGRRLFQTVPGEEHLGRTGELRRGPRPQFSLGERGSDQLRRMPGGP